MQEIKEQLDKLNAINVETLKREGKEFNFVDIYPLLSETFKNIKALEASPEFWDLLPHDKKNSIANILNVFVQYAERIRDFNPVQISNPQSERDNLANTIRNYYGQLYDYLFTPLKIYLLNKEVTAGKLQELFVQLQKDIDIIRQQKQHAEEILKVMREISAVTGVSKFAGVFGEQAEKHKKSAFVWLIASIVAATIIIGFLWWIFSQLVETIKGGVEFSVSLQIFLAKILLLSFFSVVFYQIVKNYNANMHLYTLNKHRENSLKTFQAFVESSNDPKTKDAVLIQATKAIFEAGDTGYISSKEGTLRGIEIIKIVDQFKEK
jgi:hypothetical protein